jgi:hypothetical protein
MYTVERRPETYKAVEAHFEDETVEEVLEVFPGALFNLNPETDELQYLSIPTPYSGTLYVPPGFWVIWQVTDHNPVGPQAPVGPQPYIVPPDVFSRNWKILNED